MSKMAHMKFKTAHTQVQNRPITDRNYQSGPKLKRIFEMDEFLRILRILAIRHVQKRIVTNFKKKFQFEKFWSGPF